LPLNLPLLVLGVPFDIEVPSLPFLAVGRSEKTFPRTKYREFGGRPAQVDFGHPPHHQHYPHHPQLPRLLRRVHRLTFLRDAQGKVGFSSRKRLQMKQRQFSGLFPCNSAKYASHNETLPGESRPSWRKSEMFVSGVRLKMLLQRITYWYLNDHRHSS
jgi:hypothetical protein